MNKFTNSGYTIRKVSKTRRIQGEPETEQTLFKVSLGNKKWRWFDKIAEAIDFFKSLTGLSVVPLREVANEG